MTKQQLAKLVWESCNDLRGSISAVEYKDIILGFIFYRFVCENEVDYVKKQDWTDEIIESELSEEDPMAEECKERLGYFIAYKDLFSTWMKNKESSFGVSNVTEALNSFVRNTSTTKQHQRLYSGIFKSLSDKISKMGSISEQTNQIKKLIALIALIPMDPYQGYDVLGFIYEFLLKNFASNSKKDGEFYTPHEISLLMSEIIAHHLKDYDSISILDPTSGSGSLLINIGQSIQKYMRRKDSVVYYAQELIQETFNLTRMNLIMHGIDVSNIKVRQGDTLEHDWPYFEDENNVEGSYVYTPVDCVVSNPPYSKNWNPDEHQNDKRYKGYGLAPSSKADLAFLLHELYHLRDTGIMCIVMPHGILFRGGSEKEIRTELVNRNQIETIIGMPPNAFFGTSIPTIVVVLKKMREESDILFIDASREYYKDGNKNKLGNEHVLKIADTVIARKSIPYYSRLVKKEEIIKQDYNLNIPRYIEPVKEAPYDPYATVFGGIPESEIDLLQDYWKAFPSLRENLFEKENDHVSAVNVNNVKDTIQNNQDVKAFVDAYQDAFAVFDNDLYQLLIEQPGVNPFKTKKDITDRLFALCEPFELVDPYQVYHDFDSEWDEVQSDLLAMNEGDRFEIARSVIPVQSYDKESKEIVIREEEGRILPFSLIQESLYPDEFNKLKELTDELDGAAVELESYWNELDEEIKGSLKKEDKKGDDNAEDAKLDNKKLKERFQSVLKGLSNEKTRNYDAYLSLKPKEKLAFQAEHTELVWPDDSCKAKNGTYGAAVIKEIVIAEKMKISIPEEEEDYAVRNLFLLTKRISDLKAQIKGIRSGLDIKTRDDIAGLSDEQIKAMLKKKWLEPIMDSIYRIPDLIISQLNAKIEKLIEKYQYPLESVDKDIGETEKGLADLMKQLTGNPFDMAAIQAMTEMLGGDRK